MGKHLELYASNLQLQKDAPNFYCKASGSPHPDCW